MPMVLSIKRRPSKWQKRFERSCWRLTASILQKFLSTFARRWPASNKGNSDWQTSCFVANRYESNLPPTVRLDEKLYRATKTTTFATQSFLGFIARSTSSLWTEKTRCGSIFHQNACRELEDWGVLWIPFRLFFVPDRQRIAYILWWRQLWFCDKQWDKTGILLFRVATPNRLPSQFQKSQRKRLLVNKIRWRSIGWWNPTGLKRKEIRFHGAVIERITE